jgi:N-acyl-D-amino-acid deacylase
MTGEPHPALRSFDDAVREILSMNGVPGAALAVAHEGRLVLARGYGFSDLATREPVAPASRFRIASVSKPITAVATLKLVEEGRLSLDETVVELLKFTPPEGRAFDPRVREITVRDLLYHAGGWDRAQSGLDPPFAADRIAIASGERPPATAAMIVRFMLAQKLDFAPGSRQAYSNLGYAALGRVIEAVTGEPYEAFVRGAVLDPAGAHTVAMGRSLFEERAADEVRYHDPRRFLAMFPTLGMVPAPYGAFSVEAMDAHGGWIASAPDLLRFMTRVDLDPMVPDLLQPATLRRMVAPHESAATDSTFFAMGWEVHAHGNGTVWFHRGDLPGTTALLVCAGRTQFAFLMNGNASNRENAVRILPMLLAAAREVEDWPLRDLFLAMRSFPMTRGAQPVGDSAAIRATALDYIEGWYAGDAVRMERALHPHLAKRFVEPRANGGVQLTETTALELVQQVRSGGGSETPESARRTDVHILDIFQNVASVRVDAHGWIDYMHIAKFGDSWRIVNVLWEIRRPSQQGSTGG